MRENAPNCVRRLHAARIILKTRKPINETFCFAEALEECTTALKELTHVRTFDLDADQALDVLRQFVDFREIAVWDQRGKAYARAEAMSVLDRAILVNAIDVLFSFLDSKAGAKFLVASEQERRKGAA